MCNHLIINLLSLPQEKKRREAYEEFLKEKLMIDEIVRKIYEEDQRYIFWHFTRFYSETVHTLIANVSS